MNKNVFGVFNNEQVLRIEKAEGLSTYKNLDLAVVYKSNNNTNQDSVFVFKDENGNEILNFKKNGDIFIKGKLTENDKDIVEGFRGIFSKSK